MTPTVSVIIPTYKHADYVLQTLESVFAQTFADYEIIVVNDGSPDDTAGVLRKLIDSGRIKYVEQANQGQAAARNRGLAEAKAQFIAFLDDDDLWPPDKLEWQVAVLQNAPEVALVYGQSATLGRPEIPPHPAVSAPRGYVFERFAETGWIQSPGQTLIRRNILAELGGFDSNIWGTDDWDLWLRIARNHQFEFSPRIALIYRRHQANASRNFVRMYRNGMKVVHKLLQDSSGDFLPAQNARRFVRQFTVDDGMTLARQQAGAAQWGYAMRSWSQLLLIQPSLVFARQWWRGFLKSGLKQIRII